MLSLIPSHLHKMMNEVNKIKAFILDLSGNKIITIMTMNGLKKFDVDHKGAIGYHETHEDLFNIWMNKTMDPVGSVLIRQFTKIESHKMQDGTSIPYKNIYGFVSVDGFFKALNDKELRESFSTDHRTNEKIECERGLRFCLPKHW